MLKRRVLAAAGAAVLVTGGLSLAGALPASANQVWHQSVGRASATSACSMSSADDLAAGWSQWGATWEQWANSGKGGFTCTRSITWANDSPTCTEIDVNSFVLVDPSGFIPVGTPYYGDGTCTPPLVGTVGFPYVYGLAWTSGDQDTANGICRAGNSLPGLVASRSAGNLYICGV